MVILFNAPLSPYTCCLYVCSWACARHVPVLRCMCNDSGSSRVLLFAVPLLGGQFPPVTTPLIASVCTMRHGVAAVAWHPTKIALHSSFKQSHVGKGA